jgi:hypothetical protein
LFALQRAVCDIHGRSKGRPAPDDGVPGLGQQRTAGTSRGAGGGVAFAMAFLLSIAAAITCIAAIVPFAFWLKPRSDIDPDRIPGDW